MRHLFTPVVCFVAVLIANGCGAGGGSDDTLGPVGDAANEGPDSIGLPEGSRDVASPDGAQAADRSDNPSMKDAQLESSTTVGNDGGDGATDDASVTLFDSAADAEPDREPQDSAVPNDVQAPSDSAMPTDAALTDASSDAPGQPSLDASFDGQAEGSARDASTDASIDQTSLTPDAQAIDGPTQVDAPPDAVFDAAADSADAPPCQTSPPPGTCSQPRFFGAVGEQGVIEVISTLGNEQRHLRSTGIGESWFLLGLTDDDSLRAGKFNHISASFTLAAPLGDDYTLEVYCGNCTTGRLLGRSANPAGPGPSGDYEDVDYYEAQDTQTTQGARLYIHVLPVTTAACFRWTLDAYIATPSNFSGKNCRL